MSKPTIRLRYPIAVRLRLGVRRVLPVIGFAGAVAVTLFLLHQRSVPGQVIGLAGRHDVTVSAGVSGRVTSVLVSIHQEVPAGAVIATLDDADVQLEVEAARLGIDELHAELAAARYALLIDEFDRATDQLQLRRRLELDRLDARLGQVQELARNGRDVAALGGLSKDLSRVSKLAGGAVAMSRVDDSRADHDSLNARIEGREVVLDTWRDAEASSRDRLQAIPELSDPPADVLLLPLDAAIRTAEKRLEGILLAVERRVLRAPVSGRVAAILQRPGEEVVVDEPIVLLSVASTTVAMAWLKEEHIAAARVGETIEVRRSSAPTIVARGEIESLGPAVAEVPFHALRDPGVREFGLPVMLRVPEDFPLTPGERISVRIGP